MKLDLWKYPQDGKRVDMEGTFYGGDYRPVMVNAKTRAPIKDRLGRIVSRVAEDGCLVVYDFSGHEVVSGWVRSGKLMINMYTGEAYRSGRRVRRPDKGPRAGLNLMIEKPGVAR